MQTTFMKNLYKNFSKNLMGLESFFYSFFYPLLVALVTVLCYTNRWTTIGILIFVVVASFIVVTSNDLSPILPLLFCFPPLLVTIDFFSHIENYFLLVPFVACLIIHFIRFPIKRIYIGKLFFPLLAMTVALFMGGVFSNGISEVYKDGLPHILSVGVAIFMEYFVLSQKICPPKHIDVRPFFAKTLIGFGVASGLELLYLTISRTYVLDLGWCNINHIGYICLICLPACFYLMIRSNVIVPNFLFAVFFLVIIFFTESNIGQGASLLFFPVLTIIALKRIRNNKKTLLFILLITLYVALLAIFMFYIMRRDTFMKELAIFLSDSGRSKIYQKAIAVFLENPIFGAGIGKFPKMHPFDGRTNYHSSILHPLATMGVFGLLVWLYYLFARIRIFTKRNDSFTLCMFISFILYEAYSLVDCGEYAFTLIYLIAIVLVVELSLKLPDEQTLPLYNDKKNKICKSFFSFL